MRNKFRQHVPMFVNDGEGGYSFEFDTSADLMRELDQRRQFWDEDTTRMLAMSESTLIEVTDNGFHWWVLGFIEHPELVADIPQWEGWKHLARLADGQEVVLTNEVVSACGGLLELRDGTEVIDVLYERSMAKQAHERKLRDMGICPRCEAPYLSTETPDTHDTIRLEQRCATCGGGMTSWKSRNMPTANQS